MKLYHFFSKTTRPGVLFSLFPFVMTHGSVWTCLSNTRENALSVRIEYSRWFNKLEFTAFLKESLAKNFVRRPFG